MLAPPVGFRKAIPTTVRLDVVIRQEGRCKTCREKLGVLADTQFDHTPALQLRQWDQDIGDTVPAANDPEYIEAKHKDCHAIKTTGRTGESKLSAVNGDVQQIAKIRRLEKKESEFRNRLLVKEDGGEPPPPTKAKRPWPKRPFPKRTKPQKGRTGT